MVQCQYRIETSPVPLSWGRVVGQKLVFVENGQQRGLLETLVQVTINHYNRPHSSPLLFSVDVARDKRNRGMRGGGERGTGTRFRGARGRHERRATEHRTTARNIVSKHPFSLPVSLESVNEFGNQQVSISIGPRDSTPPFTALEFPFFSLFHPLSFDGASTTIRISVTHYYYVDFVKSCGYVTFSKLLGSASVAKNIFGS